LIEKKSDFLHLTISRDFGDFSQEQLDSFTEFFSIPPQNSGLFRITGVLKNVASVVALYSNQFTKLKDIADLVHEKRNTNEINHQITGGSGSSRTGFASIYPGYECLLKTKHIDTECNVFEVLIATFFVARKHSISNDLGYNLSNSAMENVAREIRKFSDKSNPSFEMLDAISVTLDSYNSIKIALGKFQTLTPALSNNLKKMINNFCRETSEVNNQKADEKPGQTVQPSPPKKTTFDNTPDKPTTQSLDRKKIVQICHNNKLSSNDDIEFLIEPRNKQESVQNTGELIDDSVPTDKAKIDPTIEGEELSVHGRKVAAQATQKKSIMQAQFCEHRWEQLSPAESMLIQKQISKDDDLGAIAALITLTFGAEPLVWGNYKLEKQKALDGFLNLETGSWGHSIQEHKNAWQPDEASSPYLKKVSNRVELSLPPQLFKKLNDIHNTEARNLAQLLGKSPEELQLIVTQWLLDLSPRNREITLAKLRNELYLKVMQLTMDEVAAHFICGQPTFLLPTQCFYTAFNSQKLNNIYLKALSKIFDSQITSTQVNSMLTGSKLQVKDSVLIEFVAKLKKQEANSDIDDLVAYHNSFTLYTHQLMSYATGHRDVVDPFARLTDFIEPVRSVLIFDKETDLNHMGRISPMGMIAWQQFINYREHLNLLAINLRASGETLATKVEQLLSGRQTLPFMFLIEQKDNALTYLSIKTSILEQKIPYWQLPFNFNRHYLSTNLRPMLNSAEHIDYLLGHFQNGTQAFGSTSHFSPSDLNRSLESKIDQLLTNLDFEALKSKLTQRRKRTKHCLSDNNIEIQLGYQERAKIRNKKLEQSKQALSKELVTLKEKIQKCYANSTEIAREQNHEELNTLIESSLTRIIDNNKIINVGDTIRTFYRIVKRFLKQNKIKFSLKNSLSKIKQEPSPITPDTGSDYHSFIKLRQAFTELTPELVSSEDSAEFIAAFTLVNEILLGRLHNLKWIDNYSASFQQNLHFMSNAVTIDLIDNFNQTNVFRYRYSLSTSLFLTTRKALATDTEEFESKDFKYKLNQIINKLKKTYPKLTIKKLLKLASATDVIELSGINRAVYSGERKNYSISFERQQCLINSKAICMDADPDASQCNKLNDESRYFSPENPTYKTTKNQQKFIRNLLCHQRKAMQQKKQKNLLSTEIEKTLTEHDDRIYSVYSLMLEWGLYQLNNSEKRKANYINKRVHSNSNALIEVIQDKDIITMSEDQLIHAYNKVLSYYPSYKDKSEQVIEHVKDLIDFHEFLINSFGAVDIDFSDLDIPDGLASKLVNANLINFKEYFSILNLLEKDPYGSSVDKLRQSVAFCLGFNFGLRSGEVFAIAIQDIYFSQEQLSFNTLTIQPNKIDSLKTEASKRNLPINIWLSDHERLLIKRLIEIRLSQGATPSSPLLGTGSKSTVEDYTLIKKRIVQAMRSFTGDATLKFHHLRHSFASWMCLALLNKESTIFNIQDSKIKKVQTAFNFAGSRKALFQLAEWMGHAHPSTTVLNYIHTFDQMEFVQTELDRNYHYISTISSIKQDTLRQWFKRYKPQNLIHFCFEKIVEPDEFDTQYTEYITELPAIQKKQNLLKFEQVNWFIKRFECLKNHQNISTVFSCLHSDVDVFIEKLNEVIERSGYFPEPLKSLLNKAELDTASSAKSLGLQKLPRQHIDTDWVKQFENFLEGSHHTVADQLKLWIRYVHPSETAWVFQKPEQYQSFVALLLDSGINNNQILVRNVSGNVDLKFPKPVNQGAYPKNYRPRLARQYLAFNSIPIDADLSVLHDNQKSSVKAMNYYFFLAVLVIEFKKIISKNTN
jgi:integrase